MTDTNLLTDAPTAAAGTDGPSRPPEVPEKFWDAARGEIRLEALLKSYRELERKLSRMVPAPGPEMSPEDRQRLLRSLGVPEAPDGYAVECPHGLFEPDPEINAKLHAAGLTPAQVQLVYDLAADRMMPMLGDLAADFQADRELERVVAHFGGEERWREVSRQLLAWGRKHLPPPALDALASSYDGILALHRMMTEAGEGRIDLPEGDGGDGGERDLQAMMRDPRYWRDRDPGYVAKVTDGYRRLFSSGS